MHYTGNDIVSFKDAEAKHEDVRWINKNFNLLEKEFIQQSKQPFITLWKFWSFKESAYKVILKKEGKRFLNARKIKIDCSKTKDNLFKVYYQDYELWVKTFKHEQYVHSICSSSLAELKQTCFQIFSFNSSLFENSTSIRKAMSNDLKSKYGNLEIEFTKDELGIPKINIVDSSIHIDISFSHDELFSAYSYLNNELTE